MSRQPSLPQENMRPLRLPSAWRRGVAPWWRKLTAPVAQGDMALSSSATINTQTWFSQFPLRPTAGWSVVAAALAVGWLSQPMFWDWRGFALLLLLVDPLWGSLWRLAAGRLELLPLRERELTQTVWLPYLEPGSPAARLLGRDDQGVLHLVLRVVFPSAALALAIALVLGPQAVLLTSVVLLLGLLGWIVRHTVGYIPAALHSAVTVALPWWLALNLLGGASLSENWANQLGLVWLWFLHNWGEGRCLRARGDVLGIGLLAIGDLGIAVLLVISRAPLWLALMSILWLPTWLFVYQRRPMQRLNFWWLVAMLISGLALGQSL